jgi:hypothetical protein
MIESDWLAEGILTRLGLSGRVPDGSTRPPRPGTKAGLLDLLDDALGAG